MATAIKLPVPDRVKPSFIFLTSGHSDSPERQSARMSKITNDGLTRSGTGCSIAVQCTHTATVGDKGLNFLEIVLGPDRGISHMRRR